MTLRPDVWMIAIRCLLYLTRSHCPKRSDPVQYLTQFVRAFSSAAGIRLQAMLEVHIAGSVSHCDDYCPSKCPQ